MSNYDPYSDSRLWLWRSAEASRRPDLRRYRSDLRGADSGLSRLAQGSDDSVFRVLGGTCPISRLYGHVITNGLSQVPILDPRAGESTVRRQAGSIALENPANFPVRHSGTSPNRATRLITILARARGKAFRIHDHSRFRA
jgi:hypothetical protein